eukprot:TRINITY_DN10412_c0_g1_i1.p1 TRINITY_DN10412_c0_g1~~TRINITY_DN10412_c0_g1_i1.p1  ORF type:complete len:919 (+),score=187.69 TRINITY_DN10412_c0_g1_i1:127-2883(+)
MQRAAEEEVGGGSGEWLQFPGLPLGAATADDELYGQGVVAFAAAVWHRLRSDHFATVSVPSGPLRGYLCAEVMRHYLRWAREQEIAQGGGAAAGARTGADSPGERAHDGPLDGAPAELCNGGRDDWGACRALWGCANGDCAFLQRAEREESGSGAPEWTGAACAEQSSATTLSTVGSLAETTETEDSEESECEEDDEDSEFEEEGDEQAEDACGDEQTTSSCSDTAGDNYSPDVSPDQSPNQSPEKRGSGPPCSAVHCMFSIDEGSRRLLSGPVTRQLRSMRLLQEDEPQGKEDKIRFFCRRFSSVRLPVWVNAADGRPPMRPSIIQRLPNNCGLAVLFDDAVTEAIYGDESSEHAFEMRRSLSVVPFVLCFMGIDSEVPQDATILRADTIMRCPKHLLPLRSQVAWLWSHTPTASQLQHIVEGSLGALVANYPGNGVLDDLMRTLSRDGGLPTAAVDCVEVIINKLPLEKLGVAFVEQTTQIRSGQMVDKKYWDRYVTHVNGTFVMTGDVIHKMAKGQQRLVLRLLPTAQSHRSADPFLELRGVLERIAAACDQLQRLSGDSAAQQALEDLRRLHRALRSLGPQVDAQDNYTRLEPCDEIPASPGQKQHIASGDEEYVAHMVAGIVELHWQDVDFTECSERAPSVLVVAGNRKHESTILGRLYEHLSTFVPVARTAPLGQCGPGAQPADTWSSLGDPCAPLLLVDGSELHCVGRLFDIIVVLARDPALTTSLRRARQGGYKAMRPVDVPRLRRYVSSSGLVIVVAPLPRPGAQLGCADGEFLHADVAEVELPPLQPHPDESHHPDASRPPQWSGESEQTDRGPHDSSGSDPAMDASTSTEQSDMDCAPQTECASGPHGSPLDPPSPSTAPATPLTHALPGDEQHWAAGFVQRWAEAQGIGLAWQAALEADEGGCVDE